MITYDNGIKNIGKSQTFGGNVTVKESEAKLMRHLRTHGIGLLTDLIQMFPEEARKKVRELDAG